MSNIEIEVLNKISSLEKKLDDLLKVSGPFGVNFPNNEILVQSIYGIKYLIDAYDLVMTPQLVIYRQWENDLSNFLINSLTPDSFFVDVGSNFGYFTCLAASLIGTAGKGMCIAIEPNPKVFDLLLRNCQINWSMAPIEKHNCALTKNGCSEDILIPTTGAANARMGTGLNGSNNTIHVKGNTLDNIVNGRTIDIIKIDVEGYEPIVFDGATKTLSNDNLHVVFEWSPDQIIEAGLNPTSLIDSFETHGFTAYKLPKSIFDTNNLTDNFKLSRDELHATKYANIYLRKVV